MGQTFDQMKMINQLRKAQKELKNEIVEVEAGDGAVVVQITGELKVKKVSIDPEKVDLDDIHELERWIENCMRDGFAKAQEIISKIDYIKLTGGKGKDEAVLAYKSLLKYINTVVLGQLKLDIDEIGREDKSNSFVKRMAKLAIKVGKLFEEKKRKAKE